jgi:hypothetical protein
MDLPNIPRPYWNLIRRCWNAKPSERPWIGEILLELQNQEDYAFPGADSRELDAYQDSLGHFDPTQ